jgi:D-glycerate 3-kinase
MTYRDYMGSAYWKKRKMEYFQAHGKKCADMSLDDFYLTRDEQVALSTSEEGAGNGLLELRGNPGTHDLPLALSTLKALQVPTQTQE